MAVDDRDRTDVRPEWVNQQPVGANEAPLPGLGLLKGLGVTLKHMLRSRDFEWTAVCADDWRRAWPGFAGTRYEGKAIREGRMPYYLIFRRTSFCG